MNKKEFIHQVVIRSLPKADEVANAIGYAEHLWVALSEKGYGSRKEHQPRSNADWYTQLDAKKRQWFDAFWIAFNHKHDRNGAAMRWSQIEMDKALAKQIMDAAGQEANRELPYGQSRKMASGWLFERRWTDYQATVTENKQQKAQASNLKVSSLKAELMHFQRMLKISPDDQTYRAEVQRITTVLDECHQEVA